MTTIHHSALTIVAEAGVNHDGELDQAIKLVRAAKATGADIIKFQHFNASNLVAHDAPSAAYQKRNTGKSNQSNLLRALELSIDDFAKISRVCREEGIDFLCTAFDPEQAEALISLGMGFVKIPSGELTNKPLLKLHATFGLPVLLSTGMSTLAEVEEAVRTLETAGAQDITLMHCTSLYPAPPESLNLSAMVTMHRHFNRAVGYSDHSLDDHASIAAVALGASVIEKHFTLDSSLPGPDHKASLEPEAFAAMVRRLRATQTMLGDGIKQPYPDEVEIAKLVRRSWHTTRELAADHILAEGDIALKRPASGLAPSEEPHGKRLRVAMRADTALRASDIGDL